MDKAKHLSAFCLSVQSLYSTLAGAPAWWGVVLVKMHPAVSDLLAYLNGIFLADVHINYSPAEYF